MAARDLTTGSVPGLIARLALPMLASFLLQSLYQLVDLMFVGMLGGPELAALSIAVNLFFITLALGMAVGAGALALISQSYGSGARAGVPHLFQQALWLALLLGGLLWLGGTLAARPFMAAFSTDPAVIAQGVAFFPVFAVTLFSQLLGIVMGTCFRAVGDFNTPTLLQGLGVLLNLGLDPLLIFGPGPFPALGLVGAAWATLFAQLVALGAFVWLVAKPGAALGLRRPWRIDLGTWGRMLRIGIPSGLQFSLFAVTMILTFRFVRPFGADATAAVGVGFRILETCVFPAVAIGLAVSSLVGQNYGARNLRRVKAALLWGSVLGGAIACTEFAALLWQPAFWMSLFTDDPGVRAIGVDYLRIVGVVLLVVGPTIPAEFVGMGLGRTLLPLMAQVLRVGALAVALSVFVEAWGLGIEGVFWSRAVSVLPESAWLAGATAFWWLTILREPRTAHAVQAAPVPEAE